MLKDQEHFEKQERAKRLVEARKRASFSGPKAITEKFPSWNINNYKAHEAGRNGFGIADAKRYARAFKVNLNWLQFGIGNIDDADEEDIAIVDVPYLAWVSAGSMMREDIADEALGLLKVADLPSSGDWIALKVQGDSMDRISPPESIIFVDRKDRALVPNGCYVIADIDGNATYKRYRSGPMRFEPVSTNSQHEPIFPDNEPFIVGRVRRSLIEM